jgi:hypothetical protein
MYISRADGGIEQLQLDDLPRVLATSGKRRCTIGTLLGILGRDRFVAFAEGSDS